MLDSLRPRVIILFGRPRALKSRTVLEYISRFSKRPLYIAFDENLAPEFGELGVIIKQVCEAKGGRFVFYDPDNYEEAKRYIMQELKQSGYDTVVVDSITGIAEVQLFKEKLDSMHAIGTLSRLANWVTKALARYARRNRALCIVIAHEVETQQRGVDIRYMKLADKNTSIVFYFQMVKRRPKVVRITQWEKRWGSPVLEGEIEISERDFPA